MLTKIGAYIARKMTNIYHVIIALLAAIAAYLSLKNKFKDAEISQLEMDRAERDYSDVVEKIDIQSQASAAKTKQRMAREAERAKTQTKIKKARSTNNEDLDDELSKNLSTLD